MNQREFPAYRPQGDAAERYPEWEIGASDLRGIAEIIDFKRRVALHDQGASDPDRSMTHMIAHIDLGHRPINGRFTLEQELQADYLCEVRLDRWEVGS